MPPRFYKNLNTTMPRRKPKHAIQPGQVLNPNGRPRGSVNEVNQQIREAFAMLLHAQLPNLEHWIMRAAERNPEKAVDLMLRISERFLPTLSRQEIVGKDGEAFTPITIHLPNIPKVSLGVGAPTDIALPLAPAEEVKGLGEGSPMAGPVFLDSPVLPIETPGPMDPPVDQTGTEEPSPMFHLPPLTLSPNVLKDIQERGDTPLVQDGGMGEPTT